MSESTSDRIFDPRARMNHSIKRTGAASTKPPSEMIWREKWLTPAGVDTVCQPLSGEPANGRYPSGIARCASIQKFYANSWVKIARQKVECTKLGRARSTAARTLKKSGGQNLFCPPFQYSSAPAAISTSPAHAAHTSAPTPAHVSNPHLRANPSQRPSTHSRGNRTRLPQLNRGSRILRPRGKLVLML